MTTADWPNLEPALERLPGQGRVLVAYSAGPDSTCLLHLCLARLGSDGFQAIHIDHQLDASSASRAEQAGQLANQLGIKIELHRVKVGSRGGPEAAARRARYQCLAGLVRPGDNLLTAHHADDQAETVLMRLLRGAGPDGLSGIPLKRRFGDGWLVRPLLNWPAAAVRAYLADHRLPYCLDPGNEDSAMDRNYLRQSVIPTIAERWPGWRAATVRSARLCRIAADALNAHYLAALEQAADRDSLDLASIHISGPGELAGLIRQWCHLQGHTAPPGPRLDQFVEQVQSAPNDRLPEIRWEGRRLLRWNRRLWLESDPLPSTDWRLTWEPASALELPDGLGRLEFRGPTAGLGKLTVCAGNSGERIRLRHGGPARAVPELFRRAGVPPWRRPHWPRLWQDNKLLAVGERWLDADFARLLDSMDCRLHWHGGDSAKIDP